ncbi:hypothetical protein [Jatrophihabitans sp.]|uniref:hypothetical protein n=1 Tax=Jatrophihabitans sp. TaxID=1932789 RepID=UPI0030C7366A|nr:hypothetical protein [Jatrophihabitans sp.]
MTDEEVEDAAPTAKPTKAEKLEAKAAKLRESEAAKTERLAAKQTPLVRRSRLVVVASVAVLLLILLGATIGYAAHERSRANSLSELQSTRASATKAATIFATDFSSYSYSTLKADFARTSSHLTPSLAKKYAQISASLEATITSTQGKVVGKVQGIGISSVTKRTAVAIILVDQTVTSNVDKTPRIDRNRLRMTLVRQKDGSWLASDLTPQ